MRTAYREPQPRATDLETAALHDLLARTRRLRRRVALPFMVAAITAPWFGIAAHATGYWSVLGIEPDGRYVVSTFTLLVAGALCALPVAVVGTCIYMVLRARLRAAWCAHHRDAGVDPTWIVENERRFG